MRHERAGAATPLDQAFAGEPAERLVDGRAGAAIFDDELMLERNAGARRPFARTNARLDIAPDPCLDRHASSRRDKVAAKRRPISSPRLCRPPSTILIPRRQTQSIPEREAKIQLSSSASPLRPTRHGSRASSETMSA